MPSALSWSPFSRRATRRPTSRRRQTFEAPCLDASPGMLRTSICQAVHGSRKRMGWYAVMLTFVRNKPPVIACLPAARSAICGMTPGLGQDELHRAPQSARSAFGLET